MEEYGAALKKVLVVDDDQLIRTMVADMLRDAECDPLLAASAEDAEVGLAQRPFMAFLDIQLPGAQGDRFCERLRMDDMWWTLPVVMMTASSQGAAVRRCFACGADDFIPKPFTQHQILGKVEAVRFGRGGLPQKERPSLRNVFLATEKPFAGARIRKLLEVSGYRAVEPKELEDSSGAELLLHCAIIDLDLGGTGKGVVMDKFRARPGAATVPVVAFASDPDACRRNPVWENLPIYDADGEFEALVRSVNRALLSSSVLANRRGKPRVSFYSSVMFRALGEEEWQVGYGCDLSETGIFVRTLTPAAPKKSVEVSFKLSDGAAPLNAKAMVAWANGFGPRNVFSYPYGMGLAFTDFPPVEWSQLHAYLRGRLATPGSVLV